MKVNGTHYRSIWFEDSTVKAIDQTQLPHFFDIISLDSLETTCHAIRSMQVRGAPLIGATAAFGMYLALKHGHDPDAAAAQLMATRPTAVNLQWAVDRVSLAIRDLNDRDAKIQKALEVAQAVCEEDVRNCTAIGEWGTSLIRDLAGSGTKPVNILTHCNAGWLATVDRGTALAPVYQAWEEGIPVHVWVGETRPRNQGASLTAWELKQQGIPYTIISDNSGGHLMQSGQVDLCLVGSDRTTFRGNVCNKIGTYLKALAAFDNAIPFYAAVPLSSIDWVSDDIPIEERDSGEITAIQGLNTQGVLDTVRLTPEGSAALNYGFDVTPARLITGLITEHGIFEADEMGLAELREKKKDKR